MTRSLNNQGTATDVLIAGRVYSLKGADQEHLQKVAAFLNRKIVEVRNIQGYKKLDPEYKELLMDLNLADEYFKVSDELAKLKEEMANQPQGGPGGAPEGGDAKEGDAKEGDAEKK